MPSPVVNVVGGVEPVSPRSSLNGGRTPSPPPLVDPHLAGRAFGIGPHVPLSPSTPPSLLHPRALGFPMGVPPGFPAGAANAGLTTQSLPPACGARQLSKLKRFLTTLMQFGDDISVEVGENVRHLILALVNSAVSTEEFHAKLQEATNFPLRPFVIPFLKTNLPFLQRELLHCARLARQYPDRYPSHSTNFSPPPSAPVVGVLPEPPPPKRLAVNPLMQIPPQEQHIPPFQGPQRQIDRASSALFAASSAEAIARPNDADSPTPHPFERHEGVDAKGARVDMGLHQESDPEVDREIYYVYNLLSTVSVMMEKARLSLAAIKGRHPPPTEESSPAAESASDAEGSKTPGGRSPEKAEDLSRRPVDSASNDGAAGDARRPLSSVLADVEQAVAAVEVAASDLISDVDAQRVRLLKRKREDDAATLAVITPAALTSALRSVATKGAETAACWNCGREANETCSGCNVAKYCGSFCQHKDWENHHKDCSGSSPGKSSNGSKKIDVTKEKNGESEDN